jgi:lipopolysaccharide transport system permease protein
MRSGSFWSLVLVKTRANLRAEVSRYYLNYLWWGGEPVLTMLVFYVVFGVFLNRGTEHFVAFLLVGLTAWNWFAKSVLHAASSIMNGRGLMHQVDIPKIFFPVEVLMQDLTKTLFSFSLLVVFLLAYPTPVTATWAALPVLFFVQLLLVAAVAVWCAALVPFVPDLRIVLDTLMVLAFFGSGVFYRIDEVVLPDHRFIMYLNPMAGLIRGYREALIWNQWPDWQYLFWVLAASLFLLWSGILFIRRIDRVYPRICQ